MNRSDSLTKIAPALVAALGKIEGAAKKKTNPAFKSKYANLEAVIDASRDILTEHGLTLIQLPGPVANGCLTLETILLHESGEFISAEGSLPLGKTDPQGAGSAISYMRRYAQMAALNMPTVDDDGEAAHGRRAPEAAPPVWEPSGAARTAVNTLETYQRDPEGFKAFWNLNKGGLKTNLDPEDYAWVVTGMKRIAASMPTPEPAKVANGHSAAVEALGDDRIPF